MSMLVYNILTAICAFSISCKTITLSFWKNVLDKNIEAEISKILGICWGSKKPLVSEETVARRRWEVKHESLVLSIELIKVELPPWKFWKVDALNFSTSSERIEDWTVNCFLWGGGRALPLMKIWWHEFVSKLWMGGVLWWQVYQCTQLNSLSRCFAGSCVSFTYFHFFHVSLFSLSPFWFDFSLFSLLLEFTSVIYSTLYCFC